MYNAINFWNSLALLSTFNTLIIMNYKCYVYCNNVQSILHCLSSKKVDFVKCQVLYEKSQQGHFLSDLN